MYHIWYSIEYYGTLCILYIYIYNITIIIIYHYIYIYTSIPYTLVLYGFLFHSPVNEQFNPADCGNNDRMGTIKRKLGCDL